MLPKASKDTVRLVLDEQGKAALHRMVVELKAQEPCVRFTASTLGSWVIARYAETGFQADRDEIIRRHFNSKEYLKKVIQEMDPKENLADVLQAALKRVGSPPAVAARGRPKKRKSDEPVKVVEESGES